MSICAQASHCEVQTTGVGFQRAINGTSVEQGLNTYAGSPPTQIVRVQEGCLRRIGW